MLAWLEIMRVFVPSNDIGEVITSMGASASLIGVLSRLPVLVLFSGLMRYTKQQAIRYIFVAISPET